MPPQSVLDEAARIGADLWRFGRDFNYSGDKLQWNWAGRLQRFNALGYPALRGANQLLNASGVLAAFEALRERVPITAQAVRTGFALVELPGPLPDRPGSADPDPRRRSQPACGRDTGAQSRPDGVLSAHPCRLRRDARQGPAGDPGVAGTAGRSLALHRPAGTARGTRRRPRRHARAPDGRKGPGPVAVSCHADPASALAAAVETADPADRIVVFGSFYTVGGVLEGGLPRLSAPHAA